jgi:hypothetical protein
MLYVIIGLKSDDGIDSSKLLQTNLGNFKGRFKIIYRGYIDHQVKRDFQVLRISLLVSDEFDSCWVSISGYQKTFKPFEGEYTFIPNPILFKKACLSIIHSPIIYTEVVVKEILEGVSEIFEKGLPSKNG